MSKGIRKMIVRVLLIVIGAILFVWFLLPLLAVGIHNIGNLTGIGCSLVLVMAGAFLPQLESLCRKGWSLLPARIGILAVGLLLTAILVLVAVETVCMVRAAETKPDKGAGVLVVLGCKAHADRPSEMLASRLQVAAEYLQANPETVCILSGGQGEDEPVTEASCMYDYLTEHGIDEDRLILEDRSTTTRENLENSYAIIRERNLSGEVAILTNEFHEYRASRLARELGLSFSAVSAPSPLWLLPTYYVRELYGILHLWICE